MYVGRLELHLILQKSAWDRPRVPNFRSRRVINEKNKINSNNRFIPVL